MVVPVILCGGAGTRLWPISDEETPKQFVKFDGKYSLFQAACDRLCFCKKTIVVSNKKYKRVIDEQLKTIGMQNKVFPIYETKGMNTAPAIVAAALMAMQFDENAKLAVMPSDHLLEKDGFLGTLDNAKKLADADAIVTIGIEPSEPNSNYGYILPSYNTNRIEKFVEKPALADAEELIKKGALINAGIFVAKASVIIKEYSKLYPESFKKIKEATKFADDDQLFLKPIYEECIPQSFDYAIMEKTDKGMVVATSNLKWSDVGTYISLQEAYKTNSHFNAEIGENICSIDTTNSLIVNKTNKKIIIDGLDKVAVVETDGVLVVTSLRNAAELMKLVKTLQN